MRRTPLLLATALWLGGAAPPTPDLPSAAPPRAGSAAGAPMVRPPPDVDPGMKVMTPGAPARARVIDPDRPKTGGTGGGSPLVVPK